MNAPRDEENGLECVIEEERPEEKQEAPAFLHLFDYKVFSSYLVQALEAYEREMARRSLIIKFFPAGTAGVWILFLISAALYDGMYHPLLNAISDLGNTTLNPAGWFFFSMSAVLMALLVIPYTNFIYRRLKVIWKKMAAAGLAASYAAVIGLILLALFPNDVPPVEAHGIAALLSFGGLILSSLFYWIIIARNAYFGNKRHLQAARAVSIIFAVMLVDLIFVGNSVVSITIVGVRPPWYLDFPLWEWLLFTLGMIEIVMLLQTMLGKNPVQDFPTGVRLGTNQAVIDARKTIEVRAGC